jgi:hypothetical protein
MHTPRHLPLALPADPCDVHACPDCSRSFVAPRAVLMLADRERYVVELGCDNCDWWTVRVFTNTELEALDYAMDMATAELVEAISDLHAADELVRIDDFAAALNAGHILPEDF